MYSCDGSPRFADTLTIGFVSGLGQFPERMLPITSIFADEFTCLIEHLSL
jgi:hypothetical protein